eukprot:1142766-Pelagomonas_calceolata.AAC.6
MQSEIKRARAKAASLPPQVSARKLISVVQFFFGGRPGGSRLCLHSLAIVLLDTEKDVHGLPSGNMISWAKSTDQRTCMALPGSLHARLIYLACHEGHVGTAVVAVAWAGLSASATHLLSLPAPPVLQDRSAMVEEGRRMS